MKRFSILSILFLLCSCNVFSQQVTYKDLIGTWDLSDTTEGKMTYQFIDSIKLIVTIKVQPLLDTSYKLPFSLEKVGDITRLTTISEEYGLKHKSYFLVKLTGNDTLKMQLDFSGTSTQWADEIENKSGIYIRRKRKK